MKIKEPDHEGKVRVIIKKPGELYGNVKYISPRMEDLRKMVGGYIETVTLTQGKPHAAGVHIIIDGDAKSKRKAPNIHIGQWPFGETLCGDIIVAGYDIHGQMVDLELDFSTWKRIVEAWRI